ncbi:hypothetical protein ECFDA506_0758, partial [Escherichia coli FDA506]
SITRT